ncbi:hypothetical protein LEP1GSC052_4266 [Leptospira kmetyi serovar Malaysia str. Bejo-Iso9]|nr:hypothetical protein LEP1GSC052_4266 [Leptospira kmetyi serovar Malaysia str. Bejo-Iso9]
MTTKSGSSGMVRLNFVLRVRQEVVYLSGSIRKTEFENTRIDHS